MRRLILIFAAVLLSFSETGQAQAPPGWEALHLKTTTLAGCAVHYEPVFEPNLPHLEAHLKKFLAPADTKRPPIDPNEVVAEVDRLIGPSDWKPSEQKKLFETFYRDFLADTRWTFFVVTQKGAKDFLRAGGRLPNFTYDKKTDTANYIFSVDLQHASEVEMTLPLKSPDDIAEPLDLIFGQLNQFARQTNNPSIALHELVEISILRRVKLQGNGWRWFHDGMANALAGWLLKQYRIPFELLHDPKESADLEKQCNLQYWPYLKYEPFGNNSPIKAEEELTQARYAFAGREANYLLEKYGEGCVRKILDEMATAKGPRGQVLLAAIQKVTGENFAPRLARYQDFATPEEGIKKYTEALQAATKGKDLDQAISCQFRLMELRPDPFHPDNLRGWRETAMSLARQGRVEDGERLINQCVEIFQDSPLPEGKEAAQQLFFDFMLATDQPSKAVKYGKADVHAADEGGATALLVASERGYDEVVKLLLAAKADVNAADKRGATPLLMASQNGHAEVVKRLLAAKADVNAAAHSDGRTPLKMASEEGHAEVVRLLLAAKADVNATDKGGNTPLLMASHKGHVEVVKLLLAAKADVNAAEKTQGLTPLYMASQEGHAEVVERLLAAKADVNASPTDGFTPLWIASQKGHVEVVKLLLAAKADVNAAHKTGATPLWIASQKGQVEVVRLLLNAGADVNVKAHLKGKDYTPMDVAKTKGHAKIVELLKERGARQ